MLIWHDLAKWAREERVSPVSLWRAWCWLGLRYRHFAGSFPYLWGACCWLCFITGILCGVSHQEFESSLLVLTGLVRTSALRMNRGVPANPFRVVGTVPGQSEMTTSSESPEQKTWLSLLRQRQFREGGKGTLGFMEVDIIQGWNHLFINCAAQHPTQNPTASMVPHALYSRRSLSTMHIRSNRKVTSHLKTYKPYSSKHLTALRSSWEPKFAAKTGALTRQLDLSWLPSLIGQHMEYIPAPRPPCPCWLVIFGEFWRRWSR